VAWTQASRLPVWLIGGALRDLLLDRRPHDFDLAVAGDPAAAARSLAAALSGKVLELNPRFRQYRVLPRSARCACHFDLQALPAPDILIFLRRRDYTVNALAWPLRPGSGVLDPTGGLRDLVRRRLRLLPGALAADPVRALRGLRLAAELNLTLSAADLRAIRNTVGVRRAGGERVRDELFRLLELWPAQARRILPAMKLVLGADPGRQARLRRLPAGALEPRLGGRSRRALEVLAAALSGRRAAAARRLRLSRQEIRLLAAWDRLTTAAPPRNREHWLAELWPLRTEAPSLNRLAIAAGAPSLRRLSRTCTRAAQKLAALKPRLDGREVHKATGLQGAALGCLLARLAARQALGLIRTRGQAEKFVQRAVR
jgi:tRNA nucleotidyltransferase (CCA-adding enzyme)